MTGRPPVLAEAWAQQVRDLGAAEVAVVSQAQLAAAGITMAPATATERKLLSSFERLDADEQQRAAAAASPLAEDVAGLVAAVTADPTFSGHWMKTPAWFRPLESSDLTWMFGLDLPDGSPGTLEAAVDLDSSQVRLAVRSVADAAKTLAASFFAADPPAPDNAERGWNDEGSGGVAQLGAVWPHGRGTRAVTCRITRTSADSTSAFLQARRDFGMRRSVDATVDETQLAQRLHELLAQAAAEGFRRS